MRADYVPGWLMEHMLAIAGIALAFHGKAQVGATFVAASCVIGVVRMIEKKRRDAK